MATLITTPYSFLEISDGKTYIHVNDGTNVALYVDDVPQATTEIVGPLVLNNISQVSGLNVANRTLFEVWKKLLKPTTYAVTDNWVDENSVAWVDENNVQWTI